MPPGCSSSSPSMPPTSTPCWTPPPTPRLPKNTESMTATPALAALEHRDEFVARHIGPCPAEIAWMLAAVGCASLEQLVAETVPTAIRLPSPLNLPGPAPEYEALQTLKHMAGRNRPMKSLIGLGYYDTITPKVILRNVTENPGWDKAYTPSHAEVAQGRLEALLNYQQTVIDL